jgi:hypothetical protein
MDVNDRIKPCGHHPDSGCTCREGVFSDQVEANVADYTTPEIIPDPDEDHMMAKQIAAGGCDTNSPWGPSTSQADVMREEANRPGMYPITQFTNAITEPVVWVERIGTHSIEYRFENIPDHAVDIIQEILPKALELYLRKTKDYGGLSGGLGPKAPFVDMWRKMIKLKKGLWDDEDLGFEQPEEIIKDFIGTTLNILGEMHANRT